DQTFEGRGHFFAAAAEAMRRILVENARGNKAARTGGAPHRARRADGDERVPPPPGGSSRRAAGLPRLPREDPEAAQTAQPPSSAGLPIEQPGEALGVSRATAYRQWNFARAWLRSAIGGEGEAPAW